MGVGGGHGLDRLPSSPLVLQLGSWLQDLATAAAALADTWQAACRSSSHAFARATPHFLLNECRSVSDSHWKRIALDLDGLHALEREAVLERLARLVIARSEATAEIGGFPDALGIAADSLANPLKPSTRYISEFSAIFRLRERYGIRYDALTHRNVRSAFEMFEGSERHAPRRIALAVDNGFDAFVVDALCLKGACVRLGPPSVARCYYEEFHETVFGVNARRSRNYYAMPDAKLGYTTSIPSFGEFTTFIFGQPTGVRGLDLVTGGILTPLGGDHRTITPGVITLVAGPPGSGKTNLSLAIAYRMAELGSSVRYLSVEESPHAIIPRVLTSDNVLASEFSPFVLPDTTSRRADIQFVRPKAAETLEQLIDRVFPRPRVHRDKPVRTGTGMPLQRVLVVDSLTTLLEKGEARPGVAASNQFPLITRRDLGDLLERLRNLGVCVFLVGSETDPGNSGLAYLVDNVLFLEYETDSVSGYTQRFLSVSKTRLQRSTIGRHPFRIDGTMDCSISPSLPTWLDASPRLPTKRSTAARVLWALPAQLPLGELARSAPLSVRDGSHILVYGQGSAGKARFAISLAFEPPVHESARATIRHPDRSDDIDQARVLVVSFLYNEQYYQEHAADALHRRFETPYREARGRLRRQLTVLSIPPGYVDAERIVEQVESALLGAELNGSPYSAVVIDGLHNLLVQFPRLEVESLFIPTLLRVLRGHAVTVITTFTHFVIARGGKDKSTPSWIALSSSERSRQAPPDRVTVSQHLLYHLLVSSMDYTLVVERSESEPAPNDRCVRVELVQSLEPTMPLGRPYWWDVELMKPLPE